MEWNDDSWASERVNVCAYRFIRMCASVHTIMHHGCKARYLLLAHASRVCVENVIDATAREPPRHTHVHAYKMCPRHR